ncbi:Transcriptional regulator PadR-like family protein [Nonomuraea coxensis DSM 45129]|uniref:Transcriptional regulator PadR-like family protein n=2 Tax=Nonomuraea coxensis TaxID=404386 RepID=A0ABX8UD74_9ACTN|nr:Transcriptional regulator PadR-like family protein [Nonomuraea coxensis DSM 45129]
MTEATYFILVALTAEPLHGYGIIKQVRTQSLGEVDLAVGTLYGALDRLSETGWVRLDREETVNGRPRRYYRITDDGVRAVRAHAARLQRAAALVLRPGGVTSA